MDKNDLKEKLSGVKEALNDSKVVITRHLDDFSFSTVFVKKFSVNGIIAFVICLLLLFVVGFFANYNCETEVNQVVTDTVLKINDLKTKDESLNQSATKIKSVILQAYQATKENPLVKDCAVALYNTTDWGLESYSSRTIVLHSEEATQWFNEQLGEEGSLPIVFSSSELLNFAEENSNADIVITKVSLINKIMMPEIVEARKGTKVVDTLNDNINEIINYPDRAILETDIPMEYVGNAGEEDLLTVVSKHKFESSMERTSVTYSKDVLHRTTKVATQHFTVNNVNYQLDIIYDYAGLNAMFLYIFLTIMLIIGTTVVITVLQTKKERI